MNERLVSWLLFLINPFISMILALKDYTQPYAKNIFWAFCVFYGFTFSIGRESVGSDMNRYVEQLYFLYNQSGYTINELINFFKESGEIDIFNIIVTYLVSKFSDSQEILTMVYAIFFGFFYSRNIWYIFGLLNGKLNFGIKLLLLVLILIVPIWYINGIRMYLAFHVFFYGLLPFIFVNNKSKLIYLYISFLIHFSFFIPIVVFLIYRFFGNKLNIYFYAFIISLFISGINLTTINTYTEAFVPQRLEERTSAYRSEDVIEAKANKAILNSKVWYVKWHSLSLRWSLYFLIIYIFIYGNQLIKRYPEWRRLFSLTLIFLTSTNLLLNIASGARFLIFGVFLSLILIILYFNQDETDLRFKKFITILTPVFILFIIVSIRMSFYSLSITTIIGNPLIAIFSTGNNMSLNDLIK